MLQRFPQQLPNTRIISGPPQVLNPIDKLRRTEIPRKDSSGVVAEDAQKHHGIVLCIGFVLRHSDVFSDALAGFLCGTRTGLGKLHDSGEKGNLVALRRPSEASHRHHSS